MFTITTNYSFQCAQVILLSTLLPTAHMTKFGRFRQCAPILISWHFHQHRMENLALPCKLVSRFFLQKKWKAWLFDMILGKLWNEIEAVRKYERRLQGMIRLLLNERVFNSYIIHIYEQATQILEEDTLAGLSLSQIWGPWRAEIFQSAEFH